MRKARTTKEPIAAQNPSAAHLMTTLDPVLTLEEIAELTRTSRDTIEREIAEGKLKSVKIRGARRVTVRQYNDYVAYLERTSMGA